MKKDFDDLYEGPRFERRAKKRKINVVISILVTLIVITSVFLVVKNIDDNNVAHEQDDASSESAVEDDQTSSTEEDSKGTEEDIDNNNAIEVVESIEEINEEVDSQEDSQTTEQEDSQTTEQEDTETSVTDSVSGEWEPVGTSQEGPHVSNYDEGSVDWNEMVQAIQMATGLSEKNMIIWWLGNGGTADTSVSTVTSLDQTEIYRVYLKWVENEGWMPIKVEELEENPRKRTEETTEEASDDEE